MSSIPTTCSCSASRRRWGRTSPGRKGVAGAARAARAARVRACSEGPEVEGAAPLTSWYKQDLFVARLVERADQLRVEVAMGVQRRDEACSTRHEALAQQLAELAQVAHEKLTLLLHKTDSDAIISRSDAELVKQHAVIERKQGVIDQMDERVKHQ